MGLSCWSCAYDRDSCHVSGRGNQSAPAACRSCTQPLLRTGPAFSGAHTEPRKTCPRVRGFCSSAVMKHEFVQPRARQNSEFTFRMRRLLYENKMYAKGTKQFREFAAVSDCTKISCVRKVGEPRIRKLSAYEIFWIYM